MKADEFRPDAQVSCPVRILRSTGRLARIYPQIENGRVIADVSVERLPLGQEPDGSGDVLCGQP